jgi:hypothetical protein
MIDDSMKTHLNGEKIANLDARNLAWKKTRERGVVAYVFREMLIAGATICAIDICFDAYSHHLPLGKVFTKSIVILLSGIFGGFIAGVFGWSFNENRYQKALTQDFSINEFLTK